MDCHSIKNQLSEYADGVLSNAEAARIEEHLAHCADCSEAYESMSAIIRHMNQMDAVDAPAGFLEKVNARLDSESSLAGTIRRFFTPRRFGFSLGLVGLTAAMIVVFYVTALQDHQSLYEVTVTTEDRVSSGAVEEELHLRGGKRDRAVDFAPPASSPKKAAATIEDVIAALGGTVIEEEFLDGAVKPSGMTIEIHRDKYEDLLRELSQFGVIQDTKAEKAKNDEVVIRVKILLRPSNPQ